MTQVSANYEQKTFSKDRPQDTTSRQLLYFSIQKKQLLLFNIPHVVRCGKFWRFQMSHVPHIADFWIVPLILTCNPFTKREMKHWKIGR